MRVELKNVDGYFFPEFQVTRADRQGLCETRYGLAHIPSISHNKLAWLARAGGKHL
jgi:hypothetical protein